MVAIHKPPVRTQRNSRGLSSGTQASELLAATNRARLRSVRRAVLRWARATGRRFFLRGHDVSPFALLLTEMLLSRTRAQAVEPVAIRLLARFPRPCDLSHADVKEVETFLYSLGLHRKRAKRLVACARDLMDRFDGKVPSRTDDLMTLPYVGRYSATAVQCFAFGERKAVFDVNVSRVYQRVFSLPHPPARLSSANQYWEFAQHLLPRAGRLAKEFNWAVLDLGGTVCTSKKPLCTICPLASVCDAHETGECGCAGRSHAI
jgi:A/G-specific adenine glycosylase